MILPAALVLLAAAPDRGPALAAAARSQVGVTLRYDAAYRRIPYPGGDVPPDRGVCTDVVVRAYRALGIDLQVRVHQDMAAAWDAYPHAWGLKGPDPNIDHRRVPNLAAFLARQGGKLRVEADPAAYRAGDLVTWRLASGVPHIGVVSDRRTPDGVPLVIHNIGAGAREEDALYRYELTGHYRWLPE